jgi:SAM-dependent methyltransferase
MDPYNFAAGGSAALPPDQREFWNRWHERNDHASHRHDADDARVRFVSALRPKDTPRVLEIGCGQGRDAIRRARNGLEVVALDLSPVAIARARAAQPGDVDITWKEGDYAEGLDFPDDHFDGVYSHLSLHYLNDQATRCLFEDVARVLAPDGLLFFTVRAVGDDLYGKGIKLDDELYCHEGHVRHFFSEGYTKELLSSWCEVEIDSFYTRELTNNPGEFIRARARRPAIESIDIS